MGTGIEIETKTFDSLHPHSGGHIIDSIETCGKKLDILLIEKVTEAPTVSGEQDSMVQIEGEVPGGVI